MGFVRQRYPIHSACAMLAAAAAVAHADDLYSQPDSTLPAWSSQDARNPNGLGWFSEAADNFPGEQGWTIESVTWFGSYSQPIDSPGNTEGFTVRIYDDDDGSPGTLLDEQDVLGLDSGFTETFVANWTGDLAYYRYTADLPTPFVVPETDQYWISFVAILPRGGGVTEPQWFIGRASTVTLPNAHTWFFDPGNFEEQTGDVAFTLRGTVGSDCPADLTGGPDGGPDGTLDANDFFFYLDLFASGDAAADLTGGPDGGPDGTLDANDFFEYLNLFAAGCP